MKRWFAAVLPNRIGGQILLLVVAAVVLTQALNFAVLFISDQGRRAETQLRSGLGLFTSGVRMIATSPSTDWPAISAAIARTEPDMAFSVQPNGPWDSTKAHDTGPLGPEPGRDPGPGGILQRDLGQLGFPQHDPGPLGFVQHDLGPGFALIDTPIAGSPPGHDYRLVSVRTPDGAVVSGKLMLPPPPPGQLAPTWSLLIFALVFLPLIYFWGAWGLSRQLNSFARAAEGFSAEGQHEQLPENGPEEIAQVARALNRMRERIMGLLSDRTRMLSAIGHDLRTPITRLRLRAEFIEDEHTRFDILRDLDRMNRMVDSALTYIRDGRESEKLVAIDLPALLRTVTDNFTDVGEPVSYEGPEHLNVVAQPDALVRAVENLVENAIKYGSQAVVRSGAQGDGHVFIEVEDNGVGIPEAQREAMLQPFVRGDVARSGSAGGFGLGLSITDSIARAHGGRLELSSGRMGGLLARLLLPANALPVRQAA